MENTKGGCCGRLWAKLSMFALQNHNAEKEGNHAIVNVCVHFAYLMVTIFLTISTKNISLYYYEGFMKRLFVTRSSYNVEGFEFTFEDVVTTGDWWSYIQTTFLHNIELLLAPFGESDHPSGGHVFINAPILRQIRIKNETCNIHPSLRNQFRTCFGTYSEENEDVLGFFNDTYVYQSDINGYTLWGKICKYYGGGYIQELTLDIDYAKKHLDDLQSTGWIDRATRAVLIEFALFNANINSFCNIKLLTEILPSGGMLSSWKIQPIGLVMYSGYFNWFCAALFCAITFYKTLRIALITYVIGCAKVLRSKLFHLDLLTVSVGYLLIAYNCLHYFYLQEIFTNYEMTKSQSRSLTLDKLSKWNMYYSAALGVLIYLLWIKINYYFKFKKAIRQFYLTFERCWMDLLGFALMFLIVFMAYANLSVLIFGTQHEHFRDFSTALLTMIRMVLGDINYEEMEESSIVLGPAFFLSYILFVFFILLNMFLAIINGTYSEITAEPTTEEADEKTNDELENTSDPDATMQDKELTNTQDGNKKILESIFELVSIPRNQEEEKALGLRIRPLEKILKKLTVQMKEIHNKIGKTKKT